MGSGAREGVLEAVATRAPRGVCAGSAESRSAGPRGASPLAAGALAVDPVGPVTDPRPRVLAPGERLQGAGHGGPRGGCAHSRRVSGGSFVRARGREGARVTCINVLTCKSQDHDSVGQWRRERKGVPERREVGLPRGLAPRDSSHPGGRGHLSPGPRAASQSPSPAPQALKRSRRGDAAPPALPGALRSDPALPAECPRWTPGAPGEAGLSTTLSFPGLPTSPFLRASARGRTDVGTCGDRLHMFHPIHRHSDVATMSSLCAHSH